MCAKTSLDLTEVAVPRILVTSLAPTVASLLPTLTANTAYPTCFSLFQPGWDARIRRLHFRSPSGIHRTDPD